MNIKSMLLGTAAGLMAVSAANAADLPGEAVPAAVDYVKVCDAFGAGFFYIPGTETCLDISGRVRFTVDYTTDTNLATAVKTKRARFGADGRVDFDARTATEYGTLRSFFRLTNEDDDGTVEIGSAFISIGYLTVGYTGDLFNGDVLYGIDTNGYFIGDQDRVGIQVLADDLGGGFYVGASVESVTDGWIRRSVGGAGQLYYSARAGIAGQPWGGVDVSFAYGPDATTIAGTLRDVWAVKGTADLTLIENLNARLVAAYSDRSGAGSNSVTTLGGAVSYTMDPATLYAGVSYDIQSGPDAWGANVGVDYTITSGLIGTAEVSYDDNGPNEAINVWARLTRNW